MNPELAKSMALTEALTYIMYGFLILLYFFVGYWFFSYKFKRPTETPEKTLLRWKLSAWGYFLPLAVFLLYVSLGQGGLGGKTWSVLYDLVETVLGWPLFILSVPLWFISIFVGRLLLLIPHAPLKGDESLAFLIMVWAVLLPFYSGAVGWLFGFLIEKIKKLVIDLRARSSVPQKDCGTPREVETLPSSLDRGVRYAQKDEGKDSGA